MSWKKSITTKINSSDKVENQNDACLLFRFQQIYYKEISVHESNSQRGTLERHRLLRRIRHVDWNATIPVNGLFYMIINEHVPREIIQKNISKVERHCRGQVLQAVLAEKSVAWRGNNFGDNKIETGLEFFFFGKKAGPKIFHILDFNFNLIDFHQSFHYLGVQNNLQTLPPARTNLKKQVGGSCYYHIYNEFDLDIFWLKVWLSHHAHRNS